jgi:hypothetical protein
MCEMNFLRRERREIASSLEHSASLARKGKRLNYIKYWENHLKFKSDRRCKCFVRGSTSHGAFARRRLCVFTEGSQEQESLWGNRSMRIEILQWFREECSSIFAFGYITDKIPFNVIIWIQHLHQLSSLFLHFKMISHKRNFAPWKFMQSLQLLFVLYFHSISSFSRFNGIKNTKLYFFQRWELSSLESATEENYSWILNGKICREMREKV